MPTKLTFDGREGNIQQFSEILPTTPVRLMAILYTAHDMGVELSADVLVDIMTYMRVPAPVTEVDGALGELISSGHVAVLDFKDSHKYALTDQGVLKASEYISYI